MKRPSPTPAQLCWCKSWRRPRLRQWLSGWAQVRRRLGACWAAIRCWSLLARFLASRRMPPKPSAAGSKWPAAVGCCIPATAYWGASSSWPRSPQRCISPRSRNQRLRTTWPPVSRCNAPVALPWKVGAGWSSRSLRAATAM